MSYSQRLADIETQAFANTAKIQNLSATNQSLKQQGREQEELIARYQRDLDNPAPPPTLTDRCFPPPDIPPTPFNVVARTAPSLELRFIIPGHKGEILEYRADTIDLAFILERTLKRRGYGDDMMQKGVLDFWQVPLIKVVWMREERFGNLLKSRLIAGQG